MNKNDTPPMYMGFAIISPQFSLTSAGRAIGSYDSAQLKSTVERLKKHGLKDFEDFLDYDVLADFIKGYQQTQNLTEQLINTAVEQYQKKLVQLIVATKQNPNSNKIESWTYLKPHILRFNKQDDAIATLAAGNSICLDGQLLVEVLSSGICRDWQEECPNIISGANNLKTRYKRTNPVDDFNRPGGRLSTKLDYASVKESPKPVELASQETSRVEKASCNDAGFDCHEPSGERNTNPFTALREDNFVLT